MEFPDLLFSSYTKIEHIQFNYVLIIMNSIIIAPSRIKYRVFIEKHG